MNMSMHKMYRKEPLVWVMLLGVAVGLVFGNVVKGAEGDKSGFLNADMLFEVKYMSVDSSSFFFYVFRKRMELFIGLILLATTYLGVIVAYSYAGWIGVSIGTICASSISYYGIKGILLFVTTLFPHYLFYIPAWILLLKCVREICFCIYFPAKRNGIYVGGRKEEVQHIVVLLIKVLVVVIIGILMESYVNPMALLSLLKIF